MDPQLLKALVAAVVVLGVFGICFAKLRRHRSRGILLATLGVACLMIVVLTHVFEALRVASFMGWGRPASPGHYLDFFSAVLGGALVLIGVLLHFLVGRRLTSAWRRRGV